MFLPNATRSSPTPFVPPHRRNRTSFRHVISIAEFNLELMTMVIQRTTVILLEPQEANVLGVISKYKETENIEGTDITLTDSKGQEIPDTLATQGNTFLLFNLD